MFDYAVIEPNGYIGHLVSDSDTISYDKMVSIVGGYIEGVYLNGATAYVNEEGKLQGLPKNIWATNLAHAHNAIYGDDWIAGNMLIIGNPDEEGDNTSLTTEWINANLKEIVNV